eukprot:TRINITY_DN54453_c0_g1_i2.p1 TRINITY_DN54453_c0_g1~~TRINITY_DN54453_c0_g1_i2.p1  ORF type:complete len:458 (+),score=95.02 TRINITY_DN54453_c0_g1_i2:163-1536(+)
MLRSLVGSEMCIRDRISMENLVKVRVDSSELVRLLTSLMTTTNATKARLREVEASNCALKSELTRVEHDLNECNLKLDAHHSSLHTIQAVIQRVHEPQDLASSFTQPGRPETKAARAERAHKEWEALDPAQASRLFWDTLAAQQPGAQCTAQPQGYSNLELVALESRLKQHLDKASMALTEHLQDRVDSATEETLEQTQGMVLRETSARVEASVAGIEARLDPRLQEMEMQWEDAPWREEINLHMTNLLEGQAPVLPSIIPEDPTRYTHLEQQIHLVGEQVTQLRATKLDRSEWDETVTGTSTRIAELQSDLQRDSTQLHETMRLKLENFEKELATKTSKNQVLALLATLRPLMDDLTPINEPQDPLPLPSQPATSDLEYWADAVGTCGLAPYFYTLDSAKYGRSKLVRAITPVSDGLVAVSYTHLRAHETPEHLVCRLLLEKKKKKIKNNLYRDSI